MSATDPAFDLQREIASLWSEDTARGGRVARTLLKQPDLRLVLTVIRAGARMPEHKAAGRLLVQTLQGRIRLRVAAWPGPVDLPAGHVLPLDAGVPHDVEAVEDSAFLLTVAMPVGG